uniref:HNH nuclease domain-containing protein n=1 Tax=viral metagenome TaxID=1070528 RepID=A0A6C0EQT7_9ZZZZ
MEYISLSIINLRTNKENALATNQIYLNKSPEFQRCYEAWDDKLRTRFIESIILNRATNPIWTVLNEDNDSEEILDGMHRITTALSFLNNEFSTNKNYLLSLDPEKYNKKTFNDLDSDDKAKIRNYNFIFNKLDSSYRKDLNKLKDMYEILNRSSKTLNDYEFNKVILNPFYDIISKHKELFIKSNFFSKIKDARGNIDTELIEMIVLSFQLPNCWSSINSLKEEWIKNSFGETSEEVISYIKNNGENLENKLLYMSKIISIFYQRNLFSRDTKTFKKFFLPYKFIVSRCCYLIKGYPLFNRISDNIIENFRKEILVDEIQSNLNCNSRNAIFQKKLIEKIDGIIENELNTDGIKRTYDKKTILEKLCEQKNMCPECNLIIKDCDDYEGDHIMPWTAGGPTIPSNLQILHKRCHELKSAF